MPCPCRAVPWPWEVAFKAAWSEDGMARHGFCQLALNVLLSVYVQSSGRATSNAATPTARPHLTTKTTRKCATKQNGCTGTTRPSRDNYSSSATLWWPSHMPSGTAEYSRQSWMLCTVWQYHRPVECRAYLILICRYFLRLLSLHLQWPTQT